MLQKVKVSGGGRCNVTHQSFEANALAKHYPRGQKELKSLFKIYQARDVVEWFKQHGVKLKTEEDGRMFPVSDSSQTIIDCFTNEAERLGIDVVLNSRVDKIQKETFFKIVTQSKQYISRVVLIAVGGFSSSDQYNWLSELGHSIIQPIPSLFTFNDSERRFKDLMGVSVPNSIVKIEGTDFKSEGPVLITHWGLSGPAVIRLSAWAAEYLNLVNYTFTVLVNWIALSEEEARQALRNAQLEGGKKKIFSNPQFGLSTRLWLRLCELAEIPETKIWSELSRKHANKLVENLVRSPFRIKGKTTFKEEFVTCGGIVLKEVDLATMESKKVNGLFFAGEVLNMDGETGGFNFQAAWTTAYVAAKAMANSSLLKQKSP